MQILFKSVMGKNQILQKLDSYIPIIRLAVIGSLNQLECLEGAKKECMYGCVRAHKGA